MQRTLLGTDLLINQKPNQAFNLDTILLADFIKVPARTKTLLDFGTGAGALMLYMSKKTKAKITGIEIQSERYEKALSNVELNHLNERLSCVMRDVRELEIKNGFYKDVSREAGIINNSLSFGLGLSIADINNDGWQNYVDDGGIHNDQGHTKANKNHRGPVSGRLFV